MTSILATAARALAHSEKVMDVVGHNLANVNTFGFKASRVLSEGAPRPGVATGSARLDVAQASSELVSRVGPAISSDNHLSVAIQDDAFFRVTDFDGAISYTRFGQFDLDADRNLVGFRGRPTVPPIQVPVGATRPALDSSGSLTVIDANQELITLGRLSIARFVNPQGLEPQGDGLFRPGVNSGPISVGEAADENFAPLITSALEGSNVEIAVEFATMLLAQRAYRASAQTFKIGDEMLEATTNLTR